jgi:Ca2+-binding RTX toxin-like protein
MATIYGTNANDSMSGTTADDTFIGSNGADTMKGDSGVDTVDYAGSTAGVKVSLATGKGAGGQAEGDILVSIENLTGSQYRDYLYGSNDANRIIGGGGDDFMSAGGGNDILSGGSGNDVLVGGSGSDTFVFSVTTFGQPSGSDVISDFEVGVDVLHFDKFGWQTASMNDLVLSQVGSDTLITYGSAGESITLTGVNLSQLMASASHDFLFT